MNRGLLSRVPHDQQAKIEEDLTTAFVDAFDMLDDVRDLLKEMQVLLDGIFYGENREKLGPVGPDSR
ncbi:MAG: hypothetical protein JO001_29095 [Alphaproteobacteria bacterium]|nr:hypothetical protein [Alphaproteobacteria bacterium]